jgi:HEAT repeat protein
MSRPQRRRLFGPLLYGTLVVGALATAYTGVMTAWPAIKERWEVRSLAAALRGSDPRAREAAASALVWKGQRAGLPHLLEAARDPRAEVRLLALRTLVDALVNPRTVVPLLVAAADDGHDEVRLAAAQALGRVLRYAGSSVSQPRAAANAAVEGQRAQARAALRRLLKDRAAEVRTAAADTLGELGPDPSVAADLATAADDEDRGVRLAAARALLKASGPGDQVAARTLVALVGDPSPIADRSAVMEVLMTVDWSTQDRAIAALAGLLTGGDPLVISDVIACLDAIGPKARGALPALERLVLDDDPGLRTAAGLAIVNIEGPGSRRAVAILVGFVTDERLSRERRHKALQRLRGRGASATAQVTPELIRQLGDTSADVRTAAVELLWLIVPDAPAQMPGAVGGK